MKKILNLLLVISLAATMFVFPVVAAESSTTLQLNVSSLSLGVGETFTIATRTNSTGTISWRSSDTSVATVNSSGRISALKEGTATIRATVGGVSRDVTLTVRNAPTAIRADNVSVPRGSTAQIR
ncbi:MAG: Ig-like domain-containing protein, partial [Oscillospiraceae bacterium]|nr:Ig-like domain-containing protein [Oscillospiraceae bacterium]